ncbi:hypothetical protein, partial [Glaesserella parasuis]|uniref:hypothetical protein n=1 Tax=Glaesserella parasuis TaxID=738 RepID=UPI003B67B33F
SAEFFISLCVMPFHFLFHIIPFNSIFSLIYLTYLMMVMLDWFTSLHQKRDCRQGLRHRTRV